MTRRTVARMVLATRHPVQDRPTPTPTARVGMTPRMATTTTTRAIKSTKIRPRRKGMRMGPMRPIQKTKPEPALNKVVKAARVMMALASLRRAQESQTATMMSMVTSLEELNKEVPNPASMMMVDNLEKVLAEQARTMEEVIQQTVASVGTILLAQMLELGIRPGDLHQGTTHLLDLDLLGSPNTLQELLAAVEDRRRATT